MLGTVGIRTWIPIALIALSPSIPAQDTTSDNLEDLKAAVESLKRTIEAQQALIQELSERLGELEEEIAEELDDLQFELEFLEEEGAAATAAPPPQSQNQNVFNPAITIFGNLVGRADDRPVFLDEGDEPERIDDRVNLREVEIDFRAPIDPWADGVVTLAYESEVPGEFETAIEEGYVLLKKLPFLDSAPAGLKLQAGRFRPDFGRTNKLHTHDLPWITRPRSLQTFLGEEGFIQNGVSGRFFLPSPSEDDTLEGTLAVLGGGDIAVDEAAEDSEYGVLGKLGWFRQLAPEHDVELGLSTWQGDSEASLYGADFLYRWRPLEGGNARSFLFGGELFRGDLDELEGEPLDGDPLGFYLFSQLQLNPNLYLGARFDRSEELEDESLATDTYSAFVTWYTTEFLRFRLGLEHSESDLAELDDLDTLLFELNFVFGSHPVEPYWVNR